MLPLAITCPSCTGAQMPVAFGIQIDGVVPEDMVLRDDPQTFAFEQLRLFADADGVETDSALPLTDDFMTDIGAGEWQSVMAPATLFIDGGVCPSDVVVYQPKVMLPAYDLGPMGGGNTMRDFMYSLDGPFLIPFGDLPGP